MFDRAAVVRPLGHCRIVRRRNRAGQRAACRASQVYTRSVHVHQAAEPSSPTPTSLAPAPCAHSNDQSGKCAHGSMLSRETAAVRRAQKLASIFSGALAISLVMNCVRMSEERDIYGHFVIIV